MKKIIKIFLAVITLLLFNASEIVYAQTSSTDIQPEFEPVFQDITLSFNERQYWVKDSTENNYVNEEIIDEIKSIINQRLIQNNLNDYKVMSVYPDSSMYTFTVNIGEKSNNNVTTTATVRVSYSNSSQEIPENLESLYIKLGNYKLPYFTYDINKENAQKLINDSNIYRIINQVLADYRVEDEIEKLAGDSNLDFVFQTVHYTIADGTVKAIITMNIYKNDRFCYSRNFDLFMVEGFLAKEKNIVRMLKMAKDPTYSEMEQRLIKLKASKILYAYYLDEMEAGSTVGDKKFTLGLYVGQAYNGKIVTVLHQKHDDTYETFNAKVENGRATVVTNELSPFMVGLNDNQANTSSVAKLEQKNNPQTSAVNIVLYTVFIMISAVGIIYLVIRRNKIA